MLPRGVLTPPHFHLAVTSQAYSCGQRKPSGKATHMLAERKPTAWLGKRKTEGMGTGAPNASATVTCKCQALRQLSHAPSIVGFKKKDI